DNYKWLLGNWQNLQKVGNLNDPPQKGFTTSTYDAANEDQKKIIDKNSFEWLENIASFARARGQKMADAIKESAYA
ncbi:MAG: hypothetical protein N2748_06440, partial [candidate division WOR-3 bacterium]|nr:hypothetical protein [candidate division WOR-3 bacterium]